ncbi:MAG: hypothetical protein Q9169_004351 [Polycauliona sp. 2 TL-2023]
MSPQLNEAISLADHLESLALSPHPVLGTQDDSLRRRLRDAARNLSLALEAPADTIHRIAWAPLQLGLARIGVDVHLFEILSEKDGSASTTEVLAQKTGVDPVLMRRLLRYYQSVGMITQTMDGAYAASNVTKALASDGGRSGIQMQADVLSLAFLALPEYLRENGYVNPTDPKHTAFNIGMRTEQDFFSWLQHHPQELGIFGSWMSAQRETHPNFLDVMDFEQDVGLGADDSTILFVDIGGSRGQQSIALKERYPSLPGRIVVQDLAEVVAEAAERPLPGLEGIEAEAYDMFTPQPIQGARAYYLRNVLHDWPDDKCKEILENVKAGMNQESVLLIDEMVLSERGSSWRATQADLTMAVALSAMERSEDQWRTLFDEVGLSLRKVLKYREEPEDSIMILALFA